MLKRFVKDGAVYGGATAFAQALSVLLLPLYTRVLSPSDYGIIDILAVFASLVMVTIGLEITQGLARHYPDAATDADRIGYASTCLWFTIGVNALFVTACLSLTGPLTRWILEAGDRAAVFRVAVFAIASQGLFYSAQSQLRWQLQPVRYAIANAVFTVTWLSTSILLVLVLRVGVIGVIYGQLAGNVVGTALSVYFGRASYGPVFDRAKLKEMLSFSIPLVASGVGVFVSLHVNRIAIKELMTMADLGLFGIGYRLASVVTLLAAGIPAALMPLIYQHYREPGTAVALARLFRYFVVAALMVFLAMSLFSQELLAVFTAPEFHAASVMVPLLVPAVLLSNMYVFAPGLGLAKRTGTYAVINLGGATLNTVLSFVLVPWLGIRGAGAAALLSSAALFAANMIYSQKHYFVPHEWKTLALGTAMALGLFAVGGYLEVSGWLGLTVKALLVCSAGVAFVWLGLVERADMRTAWQQVKRLRFQYP